MRKITLICDGTSDLCLLEILKWIIDRSYPEDTFQIIAARELIPARGSLRTRLKKAEENHEPDVIVCHRDSEAADSMPRLNEIATEIIAAGISTPVVRAVPVRMIESWLLFDSGAIRCAASNENGTENLELPFVGSLENLPDPKEVLFAALRRASSLPPRRLQKFNVHAARHRIPDFVTDFSPLRALPSFQRFEEELIEVLTLQAI